MPLALLIPLSLSLILLATTDFLESTTTKTTSFLIFSLTSFYLSVFLSSLPQPYGSKLIKSGGQVEMGGCATKPKVLKDEVEGKQKAPELPKEEDAVDVVKVEDAEAVAEEQPRGHGGDGTHNLRLQEIVDDDQANNKRRSLSLLFKEKENEVAKDSKENEKSVVEEAVRVEAEKHKEDIKSNIEPAEPGKEESQKEEKRKIKEPEKQEYSVQNQCNEPTQEKVVIVKPETSELADQNKPSKEEAVRVDTPSEEKLSGESKINEPLEKQEIPVAENEKSSLQNQSNKPLADKAIVKPETSELADHKPSDQEAVRVEEAKKLSGESKNNETLKQEEIPVAENEKSSLQNQSNKLAEVAIVKPEASKIVDQPSKEQAARVEAGKPLADIEKFNVEPTVKEEKLSVESKINEPLKQEFFPLVIEKEKSSVQNQSNKPAEETGVKPEMPELADQNKASAKIQSETVKPEYSEADQKQSEKNQIKEVFSVQSQSNKLAKETILKPELTDQNKVSTKVQSYEPQPAEETVKPKYSEADQKQSEKNQTKEIFSVQSQSNKPPKDTILTPELADQNKASAEVQSYELPPVKETVKPKYSEADQKQSKENQTKEVFSVQSQNTQPIIEQKPLEAANPIGKSENRPYSEEAEKKSETPIIEETKTTAKAVTVVPKERVIEVVKPTSRESQEKITEEATTSKDKENNTGVEQTSQVAHAGREIH